MAYPVDSTYTYATGVTSITGVLPAHTTNDALFLFVGKDTTTGGSWTTPSGYTKINDYSFSGTSAALFHKIATASETAPSSGTTDSDEYFAIMVSARDVDTTTLIDTSNSNTSTANQHTSTALTTGVANCLVLYFYIGDTSRQPTQAPGPQIALTYQNNIVDAGASWYFQKTAAAAPTITVNKEAADDSQIITVSVRSSGTPVVPAYGSTTTPPCSIVNYLDFQTGGPFGGGNYDPSTDLAAGIGPNSTSVTYDAFAAATGRRPFYYHNGILSQSNNTGTISGAVWTCTSVDLTGKRIILHISTQSPLYYTRLPTLSEEAIVVGLRTSSNDYRFWHVSALNTLPNPSGQHSVVIDVADTGLSWGSDVGTFDITDVDGIFFGTNNTGLGEQRVEIASCASLNAITVVGGSSGQPAKIETAKLLADSCGISSVQNQNSQSSKEWLLLQDLTIGDGSEGVYFEDSGLVIEFPKTQTESERKVSYNVDPDVATIEFYGVSGDTINLTDSTITSESSYNFSINSSSTSAATWGFSGLIIVNATVTLRDIFSTAASNITFRGCGELTLNNADLSGGCTIDQCRDTYAVTVTSEAEFNDLQNCTFSGNNYSIRITGNHGGDTWSATGMTVSGGTGSYDIRYEGTGTLTVEVDSGSGWTQPRAEATTGTLTISAPSLALDINSDTASTLIRYFEDGSQTIVDSTTGTTLSYVYPDTDPMDIELLKQSYVPVNRQDVVPYNGDFDIIMDFDEAYNSSHGLTITTEYDFVRATKVVTFNSDQQARDIYSSLADVIRTNSSYYNTAMPMAAIGPTRFDMIDGATVVNMSNWKGAGSEVYDSADSSNPVEKWCSVKSSGTITGASAYYRQTNSGNATSLTLTNNVVDEVFQYWSDPNHDGSAADGYDYSGYLVIKALLSGSKQARVDVLASQGLSALESFAYAVGLNNVSGGYSGSDPGISGDLTLVSGGTYGGEVFAYEWVDGGTNTGTDIANQIHYNSVNTPNATIPGGTGLTYFELPDMVVFNGSNVETARGYEEGASPAQVGFYCSRGGSDHPNFTRFQADNGNYYTPAVQLSATITNLLTDDSDRRLQIYNSTTATEIYNDVPGATYSDSYTEGSDYTAGDQVRIRWAQANGTTNFKSFSTVVTATSSGWSLDASNFIAENTTYATLGIDGALVTGHTIDYVDDEVDLTAAANFNGENTQAFLLYSLTTSQGIDELWGGYTISDGAVLIHNAVIDMYLDNTTTTNIRETENLKFYRDDGAYPVKGGGATSGGGGIAVRHLDPVYIVETGSVSQATLNDIQSTVNIIDTNVDTVDTNVDSILVDTGTTIPAQIAALNDISAAQVNAEVDTALSDYDGPTKAEMDSKIDALNDFNPSVDILETGVTYEAANRLMLSESAGLKDVSPDGLTVTFKDQANTKARIIATVNSDTERTNIITDTT